MKHLPKPFDQLPDYAVDLEVFEEPGRLFLQGAEARCLYYLEQGEVTLIRHTAAGDEVSIHVAYSGETFAEAALFSDQYHCDAMIRQPSRLWAINNADVLTLSRKNAEFSLALSARFAGQVQGLRRQKELLAIRSATERVYVALSEGLLHSNIKQFASSIGLTHEAVYRALAKLVKAGRVIKYGRGKYQSVQKTP